MKLWPFTSAAPAAPVITPADAGRALAALSTEQRALRAAKTDILRAFVAAGGVSKLEWRA